MFYICRIMTFQFDLGFVKGEKGRRRIYPYEKLAKEGDFIEVPKGKQYDALRALHGWMGRTQNMFKAKIGYSDGKCYLVRMS